MDDERSNSNIFFAQVLAFILSVGFSLIYILLDYAAYKQRFPNVDAWTYLFK